MNRLSGADEGIRKYLQIKKFSPKEIDEYLYYISLKAQVKLERLWIRPEAEEKETNNYKPF